MGCRTAHLQVLLSHSGGTAPHLWVLRPRAGPLDLELLAECGLQRTGLLHFLHNSFQYKYNQTISTSFTFLSFRPTRPTLTFSPGDPPYTLRYSFKRLYRRASLSESPSLTCFSFRSDNTRCRARIGCKSNSDELRTDVFGDPGSFTCLTFRLSNDFIFFSTLDLY